MLEVKENPIGLLMMVSMFHSSDQSKMNFNVLNSPSFPDKIFNKTVKILGGSPSFSTLVTVT